MEQGVIVFLSCDIHLVFVLMLVIISILAWSGATCIICSYV